MMRLRHVLGLTGGLCLAALAGAAPAGATESVVTLATRPGVGQSFVLTEPATPAKAAVVLFPGGLGNIGVAERDGQVEIARDTNFLVRSRSLFAARGLAVATVDAPTDHAGGMLPEFRQSAAHVQDVAGVVAWLKARAGVPVWLVGTSMGTVSAANLAIALGPQVDGLVLTSSVTRPTNSRSDKPFRAAGGILSFALDTVAVPVLVTAHDQDVCPVTPAGGAAALGQAFPQAPRVAVKTFSGGFHPESPPCEALSYHGYFGIEAQVVDSIAGFVAEGR